MNVSICFRSIIFQPPEISRAHPDQNSATNLHNQWWHNQLFQGTRFQGIFGPAKTNRCTLCHCADNLLQYNKSTMYLRVWCFFFLIKRWGNIVFCPNFCFIIFTWLSKLQKTILKYFLDRHVDFTVGHLLCKELLEESLFLSFCYTHISRHSSKLFLCW